MQLHAGAAANAQYSQHSKLIKDFEVKKDAENGGGFIRAKDSGKMATFSMTGVLADASLPPYLTVEQ